MEALKRDLKERYIETYNACKKFRYFPTAFLKMVVSDTDVVDVTRQLIHKKGGTFGFTELYLNGKMDLSVEKIILEPKYRILFTKEDLRAAYERLKEHEYPGLEELEEP
jgi:hypothetical protein